MNYPIYALGRLTYLADSRGENLGISGGKITIGSVSFNYQYTSLEEALIDAVFYFDRVHEKERLIKELTDSQ